MGKFVSFTLLSFFVGFSASAQPSENSLGFSPDFPGEPQARSLGQRPLYSPAPSEGTIRNLEIAAKNYSDDSANPDNIIWYGRRLAYAGDYQAAINVFSEGVEKHPEDPRFYRHRGHRYISTRQFDLAIADFEQAATLIENTENTIEPDGLPNAQNIPLTTTHGNIWYHLGLAYYLKQDWENALRSFKKGYAIGGNDDNLVSTGHWIFMILQRMGKPMEAQLALADISQDMTIIENMSYHELCLFYKGEISEDQMMAANADNPSNAAVAYGIANYYYYNGDHARSDALLTAITQGSSWASFGFIAAEADLANTAR